jgi:hypothetical protein
MLRTYFRHMSVHQNLHGVGDNQLRQQVGSLFGTWQFGLSNRRHPWPYWCMLTGGSGDTKCPDMTYAVLVAPRAYQGQRVPQRAPQRRRLGIPTSTSNTAFFCDLFSFFYAPLFISWLLVRTSAWTGGLLFGFVFISCLVFSYLQLTTLTSRPWTSGLVI